MLILATLFLSPLLLLPTGVSASFSMVVEHGVEECFVIRAPKEKSIISGNYDQLDDELSADPLRVTLFDADEKKLWSSPLGAPEGTFSVASTGGRNMLCITNGIEYDDDTGDEDDRTVGFAIRVRPATVRAQDDNVEGPDTRVMTNLIEMSEDLLDDFQDLNDHQAYLKVREAEHRDLTEATYSRIVRWTVLEALVLMAIAGGQVMYLKKFFEQKRYL
eukprot:CAMPEP_0181048994 /NCGR_PEP_ID=MMETSP1070-20121207/15729_1 /TAXON_ID=265543 /ORGANISM="Minutocellus polymorphus, Strain NH13" /LENGTH=217 /DNA_ID=CAMNT_0023127809 /DNA_START=109 /DNA_END=762 /DNA_ORIENTATION=+